MDQVGFGQKSMFKIMHPEAKCKVQISGQKIASDLLLMSSIIVTDDQFKIIGTNLRPILYNRPLNF